MSQTETADVNQRSDLAVRWQELAREWAQFWQRAGAPIAIFGKLTLHGRTRELRIAARRVADRYVTEVALHQPDYGIKPYTALLGTLRIQPNVTVRMSLPCKDDLA